MDDKTKQLRGEAYKKELERQSFDKIRVANPTDTDYTLDWDGFKYTIPAKNRDIGWGRGQRVMERYLAKKYVQEIKDKMINEMADKELEEIKKKLEERGADDVVYNANNVFLRSSKYRTDDPKLIEDIYSQVWLGVEEKFGLDQVVEQQAEQVDLRPVEERILDRFDKPYIKPQEKETNYPINKKKEDIAREVSQ